MNKVFPGIRKELLLLVRDLPGLAILFIMPVLLIMVVTLAQDNALSSQRAQTPVLLVDLSHSSRAATIKEDLLKSDFFQVISKIDSTPLDESSAKRLIEQGKYQVGIIISQQDTSINILLDPVLQDSYRKSLVSSITFILKGSLSKGIIDHMLRSIPENIRPSFEEMLRSSFANQTIIRETLAMKDKSTIKPNIIQNNVPGFILFAMFFIVIPLSGSLINEKSEGSFQRLRTLPVKMLTILSAKVFVYLLVCLAQFMLMLMIGLWVFPHFFNLPKLEMGTHYFEIGIATLAAGMAAVGFGIIVGAAATTHNQAALSGSVMVVLLGIISGTFLPIHIMPDTIQIISHLSPMRWGIDNYLNLFVRDGNLISILPNTILLLLFFIFAMTISILIFARRK